MPRRPRRGRWRWRAGPWNAGSPGARAAGLDGSTACTIDRRCTRVAVASPCNKRAAHLILRRMSADGSSAASTGPSRTAQPWEGVRDRLHARGLRWTPQRRVLIDVLSRSDGHVTGAELIERCREADPSTVPVDRVPDPRRARGAGDRASRARRRRPRGVPRAPELRPRAPPLHPTAARRGRSTSRRRARSSRRCASERGFGSTCRTSRSPACARTARRHPRT